MPYREPSPPEPPKLATSRLVDDLMFLAAALFGLVVLAVLSLRPWVVVGAIIWLLLHGYAS